MEAAGPAGRVAWYARRLASMSPAEVAWRGASALRDRTRRVPAGPETGTRLLAPGLQWDLVEESFRQATSRPVLLDRGRATAIVRRHPGDVARLVEAAERVRAGRVTYFGYPEVVLANPVDWALDPLRAFRWPDLPSRRIDHRVARADPKWIWELNRLQHLPWLAEAWLFTGDDDFARTAVDHLETWLDQNPPGRGIAWRGAFEAGVRAISVAVALQGLRDYDGLRPDLLRRAISMLATSAHLCWRERSRFSSANNHLVGELAGLAVVAMMVPELSAAAGWERSALAALELEASRQILPDGSGAEQAVGYQIFTAELMLVVAVLLRSRGSEPPPGLLRGIERSADHLAAVVGAHDPEPRQGDDDEGFALRLGPEARRTVREHLGLVAALSQGPTVMGAAVPSLSAHWVREAVGSPEADRSTAHLPAPAALVAADGGLVLLRSGRRRLVMDVGPLGYLSIAAHGHADALSVTLSVDGHDVVGDPGAGSYYGHPDWRTVHRGTRVHATLTVDDQDQSVAAGPFLWTRHASVRLRHVDLDRGVVDAEHDGYQRLADPVTHRRWVWAPPREDATVLVVDEVSGRGEHEVRVSWPFHPDLEVAQGADRLVLARVGRPVAQLAMASSATLRVDKVRGDETSHLGWWSDRLEARRPSWLVGGVARGPVPLLVATIISPSQEAEPPVGDLTVGRDGDLITVSWTAGPDRHVVVIDRSRPGALEARASVAAEIGGSDDQL